MARKPNREAEQTVGKVLRDFADDERSHRTFVDKIERGYRAYRGIFEPAVDAAAWISKLSPQIILQMVDTMIANVIDPDPKWRVRARPRFASREEADYYRNGARGLELLLAQQVDVDRFAEKQVVFAKQAFICGLSAYKTYWRYSERKVRRKQNVEEEVIPGIFAPMLQDVEATEVVDDDPAADVVDMRDFIWHQAATSLDTALRVTHRVFMAFDELKMLEKQGVYRNVDELKGKQEGLADESLTGRETSLFQADRTKDLIEILEQYRMEDGQIRVVTVGNRNVLLRDKPLPFWHGGYPFVVCTSNPDLFRVPGISEVEVVEDLQAALWALMNQRLDNVRLLNNAIVLVPEDAEDPDSFEWAPNAQWLVPRPVEQNVKILEVPSTPAQISLEAEALIRGDLQNITGGMPFLSGTDSQSIDQNTATGVSIVTSLAQRRLAAKKQQFRWAHKRLGEQWIALNQQFLSEERFVDIVGRDGVPLLERVSPEQIQGQFFIDIEGMDESLMRQERRAEAQAKLQTALQAVPVFAALAQSGQPMLNTRAFMDDYLEAFDVTDKERYYSAAPAPPAGMQAGQQPGQPQGLPGLNGQGGVTSPLATGPLAPSNEASMAAGRFAQQFLTQTGPVNAGG